MTLDTLIEKLQDFRNQSGKDIPVNFWVLYQDSFEGPFTDFAGIKDFEFNKNRLTIELDTKLG